jgi:hypothetical protein
MSAHQSTKWFWSDWAGDQAVRSLTPAERGLWIDLLALAAAAAPTGYVCDNRGKPLSYEEIGRFANCSPTDVASLINGILDKGVCGRDQTGRLFNRRMLRDIELANKRRKAGQVGGAATAMKWQAFSGLPGDLPGHVPRQTGRAPFQEESINTSFGAARAREAVDNTAGKCAATPAGFAEKAREAVQKSTGIGSGELAAVMAAKGWVKP